MEPAEQRALVAELKLAIEQSVGPVREEMAALGAKQEDLSDDVAAVQAGVADLTHQVGCIAKKAVVTEAIAKGQAKRTSAAAGGATLSLVGLWELVQHLFGVGGK